VILWHTGATLAILWFVFRGSTRLDYRLAMLGSILPDLVDKPVGRVLFRDQLDSGRLWGHSLLVNVLFFSVLFFMRGRGKRRLVLVPVGSLLHLALDGVWAQPRVFWWPLFGWEMPAHPIEGGWLVYLQPQILLLEALGAGLLLWMFAAHGMLNREGLRAFVRTGHLEMARERTP